ncbi:probable serine/threonine-protein kinase DDB_G0267686 isoform X2 [Zeugodacus cucurbitae]|uniref:probable serine/threonine-protein kinase DDB_G0267686 isoform X2 n=1 Tax=Zeugodacus cucurbitae TaxID=28588 RepID=UPI0023D8F94D|nr:probable serine/threonine-protein kinase DDB_G0267686 isoform X2 [Zeugodacus cucurbitae]
MSNQFRLLLFIVVISGALCTVEDYVIMSQCAHNKAIHVAAEGTVSVTDISQTQNITIVGLPDYVNNNLKIALYAKETQRYLCFNDQWKLVGMKELRDTCYFNETIVHGYFVFRSVVDLQRRVGFTHRGKAVGPKKNVNDACYLFTKIQADQFFHQHTDYFAPKSKSTKIISGIGHSPPQTTTTATHTTSGASARLASQRAALSAAATTATVTATAAQRNNNRLLRNNNNKNKRVNGMRSGNNNSRSSNNNQNAEYTNNGHNSNLSSSSNNNNNKNNTNNQSVNNNHNNNSNLVSNSQQQQQQVDLSQQKQHNNSNGRTREHVRQQQQHQHQVRHHHNDPNLIARRQQHEHKQKRRQHQRQQQQRLRSGRITSPATTTVALNDAQERATTTKALYSTAATAAVARSNPQQEKGTRHEPQAATVANVAAKAATATSIIMKSTTTIANKRKGRRRKGRKQRKQQQQQQPQRAQQQMSPLVAHEPATPTQTTRLWSDSPTPPLPSLPAQTQADVPSSIPTATTYGDYSGEWQSSVPTYADASTVDTAASSSLTPTLSSDIPTQTYTASTTDLIDGASSLTPTSDYNNNTEFTSETLAFATEIDDSRMTPESTMSADEQINSITSQQQHFTTQNMATPVSTAQSVEPTSTTWSESSEHSWSPTTTTNETDDGETLFASPTAMFDAESVAATAIFAEDNNAAEETQTVAVDTDSFATINTTSSEIEAESSSSNSNTNNDGFTEALADDVAGTQSTTTAHHRVFNLPAERAHIGHMWKQQSGIAASIASLLHKQLLTTSASSGNKYAWRPQRAEEYSDEIIVATGRPVATETETTTDIAAGDRATWWQHHMNHSGTNFWDKGIADEVLSSGDDADLDWLNHHNKHRNASKRRHNNRKANNSRDVEAVSQQPLQALLTSDSSLSFSKKYLAEGKLQRQSSKAVSGNNKLLASTTTAHEYSSTMATARASGATTHTEGVINTPTTTTVSDKTLTTTTTTAQRHYPLQQLLGNKTLLPLHNQPPLLHFDGNSNHLAHTHPPTATTLLTSTSAAAAAPTSTTLGGDATTAAAALTTKKSIRISTQKLLATPFHQLTYVRNNAGDIDIDNMDNISVYPDLLEESGELADQHSTERAEPDATRNSRLTIVSGYLPTSATATLPESIRLAKIKINKERKRMMSMRKRHTRRYA